MFVNVNTEIFGEKADFYTIKNIQKIDLLLIS